MDIATGSLIMMICDLKTLLAVLETGPSAETALAIRANLESNPTARCVDLMLELGLVTKNNSCLQISEKGLLFLERHGGLQRTREFHEWSASKLRSRSWLETHR